MQTVKKKKKKRMKKKKPQNIQESWNNFQRYNIHMIRMPEGKERTEQKKYFK